jgi:hypothetical protein
MNVAFDTARHDFLVGMVSGGVRQQGRDKQRLLHHQANHRGVPHRGQGMCAKRVQGARVACRPLVGGRRFSWWLLEDATVFLSVWSRPAPSRLDATMPHDFRQNVVWNVRSM